MAGWQSALHRLCVVAAVAMGMLLILAPSAVAQQGPQCEFIDTQTASGDTETVEVCSEGLPAGDPGGATAGTGAAADAGGLPTRIDAGAGGVASTAPAAVPYAVVVAGGAVASLAVLRRRRQ